MRIILPRPADRFFALAVLAIVATQCALPVSVLAASSDVGAQSTPPTASTTTRAPTTTTQPMAAASRQPHAGYPTTREAWRYCPRDGSHQCVDLDIPGVTTPE
jgi:hypothetical protein